MAKSNRNFGDDLDDPADGGIEAFTRGWAPRKSEAPRGVFGAPGDDDYRGLVKGAENAIAMTPAARAARDLYEPERAMRIAEEYSEGSSSLREMYDADPVSIPPPLVIRRWRRENPEFEALMDDAEKVKAEAMMDETLRIADSRDHQVAKNQMQVRWKLSAALYRDKFGETQTLLGDKNRPLMVGASATAGVPDEALMAVAMRGSTGPAGAKPVIDASLRGPEAPTLPAPGGSGG